MKIVVNEKFAHLADFVRKIPLWDFPQEHVFCNARNTVVKTSAGGVELVVKRYKRPTLANCFIYTFFRPGKARRAYEYAEKLLDRGIETARPVAYIEKKRYGFFHTGYFISEYLPYATLEHTEHLTDTEKQWLADDFVLFTARLHESGMFPGDYNRGNIMYYKRNCRFHFALIDINRFRFGKASLADSMKAFDQLGLTVAQIGGFIRYATLRGLDVYDALMAFLFIEKGSGIKNRLKSRLKSFLGIAPRTGEERRFT